MTYSKFGQMFPSFMHLNVSLLKKKKKKVFVCLSFSFSPTDCQIITRAFCIGEYGTSIEIQLYHHFKLNRHKYVSYLAIPILLSGNRHKSTVKVVFIHT